MKITITMPVEIEAKAIACRLPVHYEEEDIPNDYPHRNGNIWDIIIDIDSGQIRAWPNGVAPRKLNMKVADSGRYWLLGEIDQILAKREEEYVPDCIPGKYGDYITFTIDVLGVINNWKEFCTPANVAEAFYDENE